MAVSIVGTATGSTKNSGTSFDPASSGPNVDYQAGDYIYIIAFYDNLTSSAPLINSITTTLGITFVTSNESNSSSSSTAAAMKASYSRGYAVSAGTITPGSITINISGSVSVKGGVVLVMRGAISNLPIRSLIASASGTTVSNLDVQAGGMLIAVGVTEGSSAPSVLIDGAAPPNEVTSGTTGGSGANNGHARVGWKVYSNAVTNASYQTTLSDGVTGYIIVEPTPVAIGNVAGILSAHKARWDFSDPNFYALNGANQVVTAYDMSLNGATINSEGLPVIEQINGVDAVRFNGAQSMNGIGPASLSQPLTIWAVVQPMGNVVGPSAFVGHIRGVLKYESGTFRAATSAQTITGSAADTNPHIVIGQFKGSESKLFVDDTTADVTGILNPDALTINYLGRNGWGGEWANARIGESGIFPGVMHQDDLALLIDYLEAKWMQSTPPPTGDVLNVYMGAAQIAADKIYIGNDIVDKVFIGSVQVYGPS